ncbi:MAG: DMT family transporter [Hyphomicrobiales bacterium]|nr:DMT family transporter [Hyphomicrobiales bacterium]
MSVSAVPAGRPAAREERLGVVLVFLSALLWSLGGTIARFIETPDHWTVVFWRSIWAIALLAAFMLWRDGPRRSLSLFREMGAPGIVVALCFATSSTAFIVALGYTTVANILLMQAGAPLIAALLGWLAFREPVGGATWLAIAAVIFGIVVMVSDSLEGGISPIGDGLALVIAVALAVATVLTRRYAHVRMTPAVCLGTIIAGLLAATQAGTFAVGAADMGFLFAFGALNLGLGLAFFASGARLIPAALAALLGTFEPILGPIWVWLVHGEEPSERTLIGGAIVFAAVLVHIALEFGRRARPRKPGVSGLPTPH